MKVNEKEAIISLHTQPLLLMSCAQCAVCVSVFVCLYDCVYVCLHKCLCVCVLFVYVCFCVCVRWWRSMKSKYCSTHTYAFLPDRVWESIADQLCHQKNNVFLFLKMIENYKKTQTQTQLFCDDQNTFQKRGTVMVLSTKSFKHAILWRQWRG